MEIAILSLNHQQGSQSDYCEVTQFSCIGFVHNESSGPSSLVNIVRTNSPAYCKDDANCLRHSDELERVTQSIKKPLITFIPYAVVMYSGITKYRGMHP